MAKLSAHGSELFRYASERARGLMAVMSDGTILRRTPFSGGWKVYARKKAEVPLAAWTEQKKAFYDRLPEWAKVSTIPSETTLQHWMFDGVAETTTGDDIEPDGRGADGAPSWLLVLGLI